MADNKYKIFRNFMVNELGISREDIKEWTMQAVKETVEKELRGFNVLEVARESVKSLIYDNYDRRKCVEDAFTKAVKTIVDNEITITLNKKK
jgi:adenylosuccinate lyase